MNSKWDDLIVENDDLITENLKLKNMAKSLANDIIVRKSSNTTYEETRLMIDVAVSSPSVSLENIITENKLNLINYTHGQKDYEKVITCLDVGVPSVVKLPSGSEGLVYAFIESANESSHFLVLNLNSGGVEKVKVLQ